MCGLCVWSVEGKRTGNRDLFWGRWDCEGELQRRKERKKKTKGGWTAPLNTRQETDCFIAHPSLLPFGLRDLAQSSQSSHPLRQRIKVCSMDRIISPTYLQRRRAERTYVVPDRVPLASGSCTTTSWMYLSTGVRVHVGGFSTSQFILPTCSPLLF